MIDENTKPLGISNSIGQAHKIIALNDKLRQRIAELEKKVSAYREILGVIRRQQRSAQRIADSVLKFNEEGK